MSETFKLFYFNGTGRAEVYYINIYISIKRVFFFKNILLKFLNFKGFSTTICSSWSKVRGPQNRVF